jgi:hypothetical protein
VNKRQSLLFITTLFFSTTAVLATVHPTTTANPNVTLVKQMQQTLLVDQHDTPENIQRYYAKDFTLNNRAENYQQIKQHLDNLYAQAHKTQINYHYFSTSGNSVSWFERITTTNSRGRLLARDQLALAVIANGKIEKLYAAGQ